MADARVVGVVGARGGIGASSVAAALARRQAQDLARDQRRAPGRSAEGSRLVASASEAGGVALVDLDSAGGGLDVLLGIEDQRGLRWPDLHGARGEVSGAELTALLPEWSGVAVLSADRSRPGVPPAEVVTAVLEALVGSHASVVLDLDRRAVLAGEWAPRRCAVILVLAGRDLQSVAGVLALRSAALAAVPDVRLVVRGPAPGGLGVLELAHVVDLPVAASMSAQRGLAAALERGGGPVLRARGGFSQTIDRLAESLR